MCLHHNHCVTIQARNIFIFMLALLQAKKRPHLCDPSSNHSNQPHLRLYPKVSSGHHKHDRNNREQSNHAYYQIFSYHPNTSSGRYQLCVDQNTLPSHQPQLRLYSNTDNSTVAVNRNKWPLRVETFQILLCAIDHQFLKGRLVRIG